MNKSFLTTVVTFSVVMALTLVVSGAPVLAQLHGHSDIEFGYMDGKIEVEFGDEGQVFEGAFPTSTDIGEGLVEQFTDDPGFNTNDAEGLSVNPGDRVDFQVLGPLAYHNGSSFSAVPGGSHILIEDAALQVLSVNAQTVGPVSSVGPIAVGDGDGDVHAHLDFALQPTSLGELEFGAYGLQMRLVTDAVGIASSDPYFVVFNFGLDDPVFEGAVEDFASIIPEPTSLAALGFMSTLLIMRRKIRRA